MGFYAFWDEKQKQINNNPPHTFFRIFDFFKFLKKNLT